YSSSRRTCSGITLHLSPGLLGGENARRAKAPPAPPPQPGGNAAGRSRSAPPAGVVSLPLLSERISRSRAFADTPPRIASTVSLTNFAGRKTSASPTRGRPGRTAKRRSVAGLRPAQVGRRGREFSVPPADAHRVAPVRLKLVPYRSGRL